MICFSASVDRCNIPYSVVHGGKIVPWVPEAVLAQIAIFISKQTAKREAKCRSGVTFGLASNAVALFPSPRVPSLHGERNKAAALEAISGRKRLQSHFHANLSRVLKYRYS